MDVGKGSLIVLRFVGRSALARGAGASAVAREPPFLQTMTSVLGPRAVGDDGRAGRARGDTPARVSPVARVTIVLSSQFSVRSREYVHI